MANNIELSDFFKKISVQYTPEMFEELGRKHYKEDREYPENFSNWYYHIKDFGKFEHAEIIANQIFTYEETEIMKHSDNFSKVNWDEINKVLKPTLDKMKPYTVYNIKNGCFSNKFEFDTCLATRENLAQQLWKINYNSAMFSTGGFSELVVRELITSDKYKVPTIYNGMPLQEEVRVFYNMQTNKIEYMVDYWNYQYCKDGIRNMSDKIIFDWFHNKIDGRSDRHSYKMHELFSAIDENISSLKFDGTLMGIWSIDFMYANGKIYLIDMARGYRSAYWNPDLLSSATKEIMKGGYDNVN